MKKKDIFLALFVVMVWGANFTVIKLGLNGVPSMLLASLRYLITLFPAIFIVKKPNIEWKYIILYGLTVGVGQFSCLFYAMEIGMPASIASIVLQIQAFISPILAFVIIKEKLKYKQILGFIIAGMGLFIIGSYSSSNDITTIPLNAFLLTLCAPFFWALSNIIARIASDKAEAKGDKLNMLSLVVWASIIPPLPLLGIALSLNTPETLINTIANLKAISIFSALYLGYVATLFGYGIWNGLIVKYPIGKIAPLSLLVPITGLLTARIVLSEQLSKMQWIGVSIILIGLIITNVNFGVFKKIIKKYRIINKAESD
ncbi:EamA family transporter [Sedimentibacter sp. MB31-C6]|uniref:EamA family transporter n=1 Tax=Sedimentibacter sp. MB31-C6 TaxID=3109366 RepID=UPI002DDCE863|nr:EamA family transporter [Sedimentibacter sp. MB36-C1]WSI03475.1 EamA family transporter [Sedimentibacter sp. MB36-C1]